MNPEIIGFLAAFLTTAAYVPQMVKVLRHRQTAHLSLGMYSLITLGIGFWFLYGVMIESPSVMLANGITFIMAAIILTMKIRHG
jgi:MtN3 and saliva related transmembrane protein